MKIFRKSMKEYFTTISNFLIILFAFSLADVVLRLSGLFSVTSFNPLSILSIVFVAWAGWSVVKKHKFKLRQVIVTGFLLFLVTIWAVPVILYGIPLGLAHTQIAFLLIFNILLNVVVCIIVALFGGWLAKRSMRK